jgi:hypothetical protein
MGRGRVRLPGCVIFLPSLLGLLLVLTLVVAVPIYAAVHGSLFALGWICFVGLGLTALLMVSLARGVGLIRTYSVRLLDWHPGYRGHAGKLRLRRDTLVFLPRRGEPMEIPYAALDKLGFWTEVDTSQYGEPTVHVVAFVDQRSPDESEEFRFVTASAVEARQLVRNLQKRKNAAEVRRQP